MKVIGVRFKSTKKIYYFNPNEFEIEKGDNVIVDTARGMEFGQTVIGIRDVDESEIVQPLQKVIRIATPEDEKTVEQNEQRQKDAYEKCLEKIQKHGLDMKLVDAEYTFDGSKLIFYFTSDGRVDFRELVKDLAVQFKTRIELRQIAVRDETKMLGGLGACGNEICCKRFLGDFATVSIKMAKEQNLSLNPTKISGLCGRLICCLNFEKDFYCEMNEKLPSVSETVMSPKGKAEVVSTFPLKESVRVKYTNPDGSTDTAVFHLNEITRIDPETHKSEIKTDASDETDILPSEDEVVSLEKVSGQQDKRRDFKNNKRRAENGDREHKREREFTEENVSGEEKHDVSEENELSTHKNKNRHQKNHNHREQNGNDKNANENVSTENNPERRNNNNRRHHNKPQRNGDGETRPEGERKHFEHRHGGNHQKNDRNNDDSSALSNETKSE